MKKNFTYILIILFCSFFIDKVYAQPYYDLPQTSSPGTYSVGGVNVGFNYNANGGQVYIDNSCPSVLGYNCTNGGYFTFGFNVPIAGVRIRGIRQTFSTNTNVAIKINGTSYALNSSNTSPFSACGYNTQGSLSNGALVGGNNMITITQPGITSLAVQNNGGDYWIFVVEILPLVTNANVPCAGNTLNLTSDFGNVTSGVTYNWTGPNGFTSSLKNPSISNVTVANAGVYEVTASNGTVTASQTKNVLVNPIPVISNVSNQALCNGASINAVNFSSTAATTGVMCGEANENTTLSLSAPSGTVFTNVQFASYGNPTGSCGNFALGSCNSANSVNVVSAAVLGKNSFSLGATNANFNDPCSGTSKKLQVQLNYGPPVTYSWTNNQPSIGLAASGTGNIPSFVTTNSTNAPITATITVTPTFTNGGTSCPGTPTTFTIIVYPSPKITVQPVSKTVCNGSDTTFSAAISNASVYQWQVDTGSGFINISNDVLYSGVTTTTLTITGATASMNGYKYQLLASGTCVPAVVSNTVILTVPIISGTSVLNDVSCNGESDGSIDLTPSGGTPPYTFNWNGDIVTEDITGLAPGAYNVTITDSNGCSGTFSTTITQPNVVVSPTSTPLTFCEASTVADLTATGTDLKWYDDPNNGTLLADTDPIQTGDYYVSQTLNGCESTRTIVAVSVNVTPAPTAVPLAFCTASTVADLTAAGTDLKWYDDPNNGTLLADTDPIQTGDYYVSQTLNGCESSRTLVAVSVNVTPAPTAISMVFCKPSFVVHLVATGTNLKWYDIETGGLALAGNTPLSTGNYYVTQTIDGCESARAEISIVINVTPAPTATQLTFCADATVADLTATGTDLKWYSYPTSGPLLTDTTPLATGNYYVSQTIDGCESTRTLVAVIINITQLPTGSSSQILCGSVSVSDLIMTGTNLKWYNLQTGGSILTDITPVTTGHYYVSQTINGCESLRKMVNVVVNSTDAPDGITEQLFTENVTVADLVAEGENITWYSSEEDAIEGINPLSSDTELVSGTIYYATQTISGCESDTVLAVTVTITLSIDEIEKFSFTYYPNPIINELYIASPTIISNVTVYTLSGQELINQKWNEQEGILDMSSFAAGVYMVKINFGKVEKIVKVLRTLN